MIITGLSEKVESDEKRKYMSKRESRGFKQ